MAENNRENLSEMEQIHRGLEEFLEKEVYEEYEVRRENAAGTEEGYGDWEDAGTEAWETREAGQETAAHEIGRAHV